MSNGPKLKKSNLKREVANAYVLYTRTLPPQAALNQDAMTARVIAEGSIEVAIGLMAEAASKNNMALADAWREGLRAARDRLNQIALQLGDL